MAKGNVATQNQIPSNSTSRRVVRYVFTYFGVLYVVSVDLRFSMYLFRSFRSRATQVAPFKLPCFCLKPELVDVFRKLSTNMALLLSSS